MTNQHGYDVIKDGRRISVKTTAQEKGLSQSIKIHLTNSMTSSVVQYKDDDLKVIFYGPKEEIPSLRPYGNTYEVDIHSLKRVEKTLV